MRTAILGAVLVVSVATLTACTSESTSGQPRSESSSSSASASADTRPIDTGTYSTEPRALAKPTASKRDLQRVESQRMAEFTTLPAEVDPTMTATGGSGAGWENGDAFRLFFVNDDRPLAALQKLPSVGFIGGFHSGASDPDHPGFAIPQASLKTGVMRFTSAAAAATGARTIVGSRTAPLAADSGDTPFKPLALPSMPGTLGSIGTDGADSPVILSAITPYKGYVILQEFTIKSDRQAAATALLPRGLALQKALIDKFPATPASSNQYDSIVVDQNKILLYTLPDADSTSDINDSVLGPRGIAAGASDPLGTMQLLTDVGSLHNATALTTVYRAETAEGAQKILALGTEGSAAKVVDAKPAASPPGLPQATCITTNNNRPICYVAVGRYVGQAFGDDLDDSHRQISAQYKILLKADQNAN